MRRLQCPRPQFSLRWLFAIVTATAVCALVYRLTGPVETAGVAVSLTLCGVCMKMPQFRHRRLLRGGMLVMATLIVWMVGVDYSDFWEGCDHCGSHWWVHEVRIFHQPVWSAKDEDHRPTLRLIAEDLGAPCLHDYHRLDHGRVWGLFWPSPAPFSGTCCLSGEDWYDADVQAHVRSLGLHAPQIGKEFQIALLKKDYKSLKKLVSDVRPPPGSDTRLK